VAESQCTSTLWKISECLKAKLSNKPEICFADFSVHAQKPPDVVTVATFHQSLTGGF